MSTEPILMSLVADSLRGSARRRRRRCSSASSRGSLIFVIFYMLMIRPQQRRVKEHQAAIAAVKKGDDVITGGGIRGRVTKVTDDEAEVEIATRREGPRGQVDDQPRPRPELRSRRTTDARIPALEGLAVMRLIVALGVLFSIPSLIAGTAAGAILAELAPALQNQPRPRPCRRQPPAARGRLPRRAEAAAPGDGGLRSRPSFAAIREIDIGDISTAGGRLSFLVRDPTQVDAAVERMRTLTKPVGLTGQRDWDVQVIDQTRIVMTPTAERDRARRSRTR